LASEVKKILEPGIYSIKGKRVIIYEELDEDEVERIIEATEELEREYGEGWI